MKPRERFSWYLLRCRRAGFLLCLISLSLLAIPACQNPFSPIKDLNQIPEVITVDGIKITMDCFLYRDLMPGIGPDGSGLIAVITLTAEDINSFPDYITADKLYVIYGEETWETSLADEIRPRDSVHLNQIELVARNGPKLPVETKVEVVVRVTIKGSGYRYIKALNQKIGAIW